MKDANKNLKKLYIAKRLIFVTIIIYVVVFFVINSSYISADNISRFTYTLKKTLTESYATGTEKSVSFMYDDSSSEVVFKDGFALLSSGAVSIYNSKLLKFSSHSIGYANPVLKASEKYVLCFDIGGRKLSVYDSFSSVFETTFDGNIINAEISDDGYLAVITDAYGYKGMVTVFSPEFKEKMKWYSADYYLMYARFTKRNTLSVVSVRSNKENTDLYVVNLNYITATERLTVCDEDRFPLSCLVKNDNTLEVITDKDIVTVRNESYNSIFDYGASGVYNYSQFSECTAVVYLEDSVMQSYRIVVLDNVGNIMFTQYVTGFVSAAYFNGYIFLVCKDGIITVDSDGSEICRTEVPEDVCRILISEGSTLLVGAEKATLIDTSELIKAGS